MKSFEDIYLACKDRFYNDSKIDMAKGSVIDMIFKSFSYMLSIAHKEIEDNKKPYLFTNQSGDELDSTGYFVSCPRYDNESDSNYFYRMKNWMANNATCNATSISNACKKLKYSKASNYVPYTKGVGTGTIYLIPLSYEDRDKELCINEAKEEVSKVINPSSIIEIKIPDPKYVRLVAYVDISDGADELIVKSDIIKDVEEYINSIPPGDKLYLGKINKIGLSYKEVEYFNIVQIYIDDDESTDFEILQTVEAKFIFNDIIWWNVEG